MFYYLYKITNVVNNKIYVGVHMTKDINDGYMGSGKVIKRAIEKHGIDNFHKDILEFFENAETMYAKEKEVVTDEFLLREDVYNLRRGGNGGFDYINTNPDEFLTEKRLSTLMPRVEQVKRWKKKYQSEESFRILIRENAIKANQVSLQNNPNGTFYGKIHSDETKRKIGEANAKNQAGNGNSQFGTMWITDGVASKKISKNDVIPDGWYKGRKIKK